MSSDTSTCKKELDELLKYAHVQRTTKKYYAFRFRGYTDEIPHFFAKKLVNRRAIRDRDYVEKVEIYTDENTFSVCKDGNYIVICEDGKTEVMHPRQLEELFVRLDDLSYT